MKILLPYLLLLMGCCTPRAQAQAQEAQAQEAHAQALAEVQEAQDTRRFSGGTQASAHGISVTTLERVDRFVAEHRRMFGWPGAAVSVATPDSVLFAKGYGGDSLSGGAIRDTTPFYIGSVTKTFTALAVLFLAEEGRLSLDAPVEEYLADFSMAAPFEPRSITLRHLLHHRSGLRTWDGHDRRAQREGRFDHLSPAAPPGDAFEYSSLNFMILGRIVEEVSGQPYADFLQDRLFGPLEMDHSYIHSSGSETLEPVRGHQNYFGFDLETAESAPPRYLIPAGHLASSARDLGRYGGMLVGMGSFRDRSLLQPESVRQLFSPMDGTGPAMAWGRYRLYETFIFGHSGNARTSSARMRLLPERGYAITVLVNTNTGPFFDASENLISGINEILEGESDPRYFPWERVFKFGLLAGILASIWGLLRQGRLWQISGRPIAPRWSFRSSARMVFDVGLAVALLVVIPRYFGVPLSTMFGYFPDLGIALVLSIIAGAAAGVFRFLRLSSEPAVQ